MVTYFNHADLVSFGMYLLSEERVERFASHPIPGITLAERLRQVHDADVANWKHNEETAKHLRKLVKRQSKANELLVPVEK